MKIIVIEGIDGCGKSKLAKRLYWKLLIDYKAKLMSFPSEDWSGDLVRKALKGKRTADRVLAKWFLYDFEVQYSKILEMSKNLDILILDRYYWSFIAYQSSLLGNEWVMKHLNEVMLHKIDLGFIIDIDPDVAMGRIATTRKSKDNMESKGEEFFKKVRQSFLNISADNDNCILLNGIDSVDTLEKTAMDAIRALLIAEKT